jgi:hypothetical protein
MAVSESEAPAASDPIFTSATMPTTSRGSSDIIFSVTRLPSGFWLGQKR